MKIYYRKVVVSIFRLQVDDDDDDRAINENKNAEKKYPRGND